MWVSRKRQVVSPSDCIVRVPASAQAPQLTRRVVGLPESPAVLPAAALGRGSRGLAADAAGALMLISHPNVIFSEELLYVLLLFDSVACCLVDFSS